jgi:undecaprenyl-diphosphatase
MEILYAAILGVVQGLTEFLPISSSAHLILVPWFFGWKSEGIAFDVSLHVGTAIAVLTFFWRDWTRLGREVFAGLKKGTLLASPSQKLFWLLAVGTIPALVAGLALEGTAESKLRSPLITVFTLAALAAVLYWAERKSKQNRNMDQFTWADSIWIGLSQALALIPGVSRSGITITTAMFRDSDRTNAARFSFMLSTPVIVGAGLLEGWHLFRALHSPATVAVEANWAIMVVGTLFAAVTGFLCIRYFLRYLQTRSFTPFVVYRCILALIVLVYYLRSL